MTTAKIKAIMLDVVKKIVVLSVLTLLWWLASVAVDRSILPAPLTVFDALIHNRSVILSHAWYSLRRIGGGVGLALLVSIPIGMFMGYYRMIDSLFSPVIYILSPTPKITFLPLIMLFLGLGDNARIFLVFLTLVFPLIVALRDAIKKIPDDVYAPLIAAKCSHVFILYHIVFLGGLPAIFTALRLSLAVGISVLFISENFGTRMGLGYFIMDSWMTIRYPAMFAGILSMGILGFVLTAFVDFLQKKICPWAESR